MTAAFVYKNHAPAHRITGQALLGSGPLDLSDKRIDVILNANSIVVTLSLGSGVRLEAGLGNYSFDLTPATHTALGLPTQINTVINIWNLNNTLALNASGLVNVTL